jgi:hypothetical protein
MRDQRQLPLVLGATAIVVLAAVLIVASIRPSPSSTALASGSPVASASSAPTATSASAPSAAPSTAPTASSAGGAFTDTKYGFAVTLVSPYRLSSKLTRENPPLQRNGGENSKKQALQRDVFTGLTASAEDAAMQGKDCEVDCDAWNGTVVVYVYGDAGSMTPRQWMDAGNGPGSPGRMTDVTLGGRPALRIEPAGRYDVMYIAGCST